MIDAAMFVWRNPAYALKNWRDLSAVRKAMAAHKKDYPACEYCGGLKGVEIHHIIPVQVAPENAGDRGNMISLCRPRNCHLLIGHRGDYKRFYTLDPMAICVEGGDYAEVKDGPKPE